MSKMNRKVYQLEAIEVIVTMPSYQNQLTGKGTGNTVTLRTGRSGHYARTAITSTYQPRRNTQAVQSAHRQAGFVQPTRVRDTAIRRSFTLNGRWYILGGLLVVLN